MAKTNFSKVESSLDKGIEKLKIQKIVDETHQKDGEEKTLTPKMYLIETINYDIDDLPHVEPNFFKQLGITKKEIKQLLKKPEKLEAKDWKLLQELRKKIDAIKKELLKKYPPITDEELIKEERERHVNIRFNTNDRWLPLH